MLVSVVVMDEIHPCFENLIVVGKMPWIGPAVVLVGVAVTHEVE